MDFKDNVLPKRFVVKRSEWARGGRAGDSKLMGQNGMKCCVGFLALEMGLEPSQILKKAVLSDAIRDVMGLDANGYVMSDEEYNALDRAFHGMLGEDESIYETNDATRFSEKDREQKLKYLFMKRLGIEMVVED